jgi:hypothetical protein
MSDIKKYKSGKRTYTKIGGNTEQVTVAGKKKEPDTEQQPVGQPVTKDIKVDIDQTLLSGKFANGFMVSHTQDEFIIDFVNTANDKSKVESRVILTPRTAKRLRELLEKI